MRRTVNDAKPATEETGAVSKTNLAHWTAVPVLHAGATSCGKGPGVEDLLDENDAHALQQHAEKIAQIRDATTLDGKTYEVATTSGMWFFRRSPEAGWTACSNEFVALIEERLQTGIEKLVTL